MSVKRVCPRCGKTFTHASVGRPPRKCPKCRPVGITASRRRGETGDGSDRIVGGFGANPEPEWAAKLREAIRERSA